MSELEAGRRTIVRDPDDPMQEANILDSLMVGREDELEDELRAAYAVVRNRRPRRKSGGCDARASQVVLHPTLLEKVLSVSRRLTCLHHAVAANFRDGCQTVV